MNLDHNSTSPFFFYIILLYRVQGVQMKLFQ